MSWVPLLVGAGLLAPWVGLIMVVVIQGHHMARILALEERVNALTEDLGWKKD